jgi:hypothetical protein
VTTAVVAQQIIIVARECDNEIVELSTTSKVRMPRGMFELLAAKLEYDAVQGTLPVADVKLERRAKTARLIIVI